MQESSPHSKPNQSYARFQWWPSPEPETLGLVTCPWHHEVTHQLPWANVFISNAHCTGEVKIFARHLLDRYVLSWHRSDPTCRKLRETTNLLNICWGMKLVFASASNTKTVIYKTMLHKRHNPWILTEIRIQKKHVIPIKISSPTKRQHLKHIRVSKASSSRLHFHVVRSGT